MKKSIPCLQNKKRPRSSFSSSNSNGGPSRNSSNDVDNVLNAIMMDSNSSTAYSSNSNSAMDGIGSFGLFDIVTKHKSTAKKKKTTSSLSTSTSSTKSSFTRTTSSRSSTNTTTMNSSRKSNSLLTKRRPSSKKRNLFSNSSSFVTANSLKNDPFFQSILKNTSIATSNNARTKNQQVTTNNKHHDAKAEQDSRNLLSLKQIDATISKKTARAQNMKKKNDKQNSTSGTKITSKNTIQSDDKNVQDKEIHPFFLWKNPKLKKSDKTSASSISHTKIKTDFDQAKDETSSIATRSSSCNSTNHKLSESNQRNDPIINIDDEHNNETYNHQDVNNSHSNLSISSTNNKSQSQLKFKCDSASSSTTLQKQEYSKELKNNNIIQRLYDRSINGNNTRRKRHLLINGIRKGNNDSNNSSRDGCHMHQHIHKSWNINNSINLNIHTNNSIHNQSEITCMEFDKDGILLAVGDSLGYIRIFDFDEVNAASLKNRSKKRRSNNSSNKEIQTKEIRDVRPCIAFRTGSHRISCIKWNPTNEDLLIVSFLNNNEIRIFDITSTSNNKPLFVNLLDSNDRRFSRSTGYTALHIIPPTNQTSNDNMSNKGFSKLIVGGSNGAVKLWEVPSCNILKSNQKRSKLLWTITTLSEKITEIVHIDANSGLVLIGTGNGSFYLFDIYKCARKSFSSLKTPEQIKAWNLTNPNYGLGNQMLPNRDCVGVKKCYLVGMKNNLPGRNDICKDVSCLQLDFMVCLYCGWIIKMQVDVIERNGHWKVSKLRFKVIHKPSFVNYRDDEGNEGVKANPPICVPDYPTPTAILRQKDAFFVLISDVRPIDITLPSRDKRVQGESNDGIQSRNGCDHDKILIVNHKMMSQGAEEVTAKMILPRGGKLKHIAMHPDNIWLVVTIDNSLRILQAQVSKKPKKPLGRIIQHSSNRLD